MPQAAAAAAAAAAAVVDNQLDKPASVSVLMLNRASPQRVSSSGFVKGNFVD